MSDAPSISIGTITGGQNNIGKTEIAGDQVQNNHYGGTSPADVFEAVAKELPPEVVEDTVEPLQAMACMPIADLEQPEAKEKASNLLERLTPYSSQISKGLLAFGEASLTALASSNPIIAGLIALCKAVKKPAE